MKKGYFTMADGTRSSEHKAKLKKRAKKGEEKPEKAKKAKKEGKAKATKDDSD